MIQADTAEKQIAIAQQTADANTQLAQAKMMEAETARLSMMETIENRIQTLRDNNKDATYWERQLARMQSA